MDGVNEISVTTIFYDLLLHSHLKWNLDDFYRTSEWPSTGPGMEMVVNLQ